MDLADASVMYDEVYRAAVILDIKPNANILALAVYLSGRT